MNILNVEKVSKAFGEKVLLDNVTLGINKGDKIGIIGVNGTGKSTLLKIIAGIEEPDEGNIIKGRKVTVTYLAQSPDYIKDENVNVEVLQNVVEIFVTFVAKIHRMSQRRRKYLISWA